MPTLHEARIRRMMTIRGLAKLAGLAPTTIQLAESGQRQPRFGTMKKIAAALGVEPTEIAEFSTAIEDAIEGKEAA